jgi:lantibiotic biosynthesis protein
VAWRAILDGELAARAVEAVDAIAEAIPRFAADRPDLPGGDAGLALFYAYLARAGRGGEDAAAFHLERAADALAEVALPADFHGGYSGVAWAIAHVWGWEERGAEMEAAPGAEVEAAAPTDADVADGGADDFAAEIDAALLELVSASPWPGGYDLVGGLVGIGVYGLARRDWPGGPALVEAVAARLAEKAEPAGDGLTLWTPAAELGSGMRAEYPAGHANLGVAHGVPGAIALLGSVAGDGARRLREGLTAWMRSVRRRGADGSLYPYAIALDRPGAAAVPPPARDARCRAAWCYGDPGIAAALLRGARACGDAGLEELAVEAGRAAAVRLRDGAGVVDAGLCHGSAGLLHLFNRLYQATGDEAFRAAALRWAAETLALRGADRGAAEADSVAGFAAYRPQGESVADPGFLTGAAGIGLALLAATSDVEPGWDAALLCDVPPR